ncbi:MAG: type III secretion T3S chaperone [Parachlamydiales bacterium]|nr:type III secretion T3S chaperone [Parachlamydiales bacterium]
MLEEKYPLEQLARIKKKRFEDAIKILEQKSDLLKKEQKKYKELEAKREEIQLHKKAKIEQLQASIAEGTTSNKIQQKKQYIEVVSERLLEQMAKVEKQKMALKKAQKDFDEAKTELFNRKKDIEKLDIHKAEWKKEIHKMYEQAEALEQDEIGSIRYTMQKKEKRR